MFLTLLVLFLDLLILRVKGLRVRWPIELDVDALQVAKVAKNLIVWVLKHLEGVWW